MALDARAAARGPRDRRLRARPRGARSTPPRRAPAWHLTRAAPPKFPREGPRDKSLSRNSPEVRGARPARPSARGPPRAPAGPARAHAALCFLSGRALPTCSIRDVGLFLRGETLDDHPGDGSRPRAPRESGACPPPSSPQQQAHLIKVSQRPRGETPDRPPRTGGELATFTLLFKLARRHHQQITLSCRPAPTAPAPRRRPGAGHSHGPPAKTRVAAPSTWSVMLSTKRQCPPEFAHSCGADNAAASIPKSTWL